MAITSYSELQTALTDRIARADFTAAQQQECIAFAEAEMQRILKTLDMETKDAAFSITGEYVATPTGLLFVREFCLNTTPLTPLSLMPGDMQSSAYARGEQAKPKFFEIVGANFRFAPVPDTTYTATIVYSAQFAPLTVSATTNWLLTAHPDAYLYGSLKHAAIRIQDANAASGYDSLFKNAMADVNAQASRIRFSGPALAVRAN